MTHGADFEVEAQFATDIDELSACTHGWGWMLVILLAMLAIPLLMIPIHNGRVARQAVA